MLKFSLRTSQTIVLLYIGFENCLITRIYFLKNLETFFPEALFDFRFADLLHEEFLEWVAVKTHLLFGREQARTFVLWALTRWTSIFIRSGREIDIALSLTPPPPLYALKETTRQIQNIIRNLAFGRHSK
jgi:hypothetical protein